MAIDTKTKIEGILVEKFGGPDVMKFSEVELPSPGPGEVKLKIYAAGVNFIDVNQRRGRYKTTIELPFVPGLEGAGIVQELGFGVKEVKVGDKVAYAYGRGSYAQAANVPAKNLIPLPSDFSFEQGAAFPLQGMTAQYLLHEFHKIKAGETILIHAAAGGMGSFLVPWAKRLGARVIGTVSTEGKAKIAKVYGADEIIIYTEEDFVTASKRLTNGKGPDLILDSVGKDTFTKDLEAISLRGHIVLYGSASGAAEPLMPNSLQTKSITVSGGSLFNFIDNRKELLMRANEVLQGIKEGWLKLNIEKVMSLAEAEKAHEMMENRKTTGKIVLKCSD
jgi:NADPH2:quinone reductase